MATTPLNYLNQYFTTALNVGGGIDASQTTGIIVSDVSGIDTAKPGVALIDYATPLNTATAEWVTYTSINGSKELVGATRGAEGFSAKTHDNSVAVAFPLSESHINNLNAMFDSTGVDIKQIATPASPDSGRDKLYFKSDDMLYGLTSGGSEYGIGTNSSLSRQAIINGNFDVWQRGTSVALTAADGYTADRWYAETATATTDKTISRQDGTGVNGSYYCLRYLAAQDVDALNTLSQALESQDSIKFRGQKVTLSFYARGGAEFVADNATLVSKIVTGKGTDEKVLAFTTSADGVSQNNTLTTSWVKFTCTTTAVIAADITQIGVSFAFTHAGAGITTNYFEVTQVQLCAGSVALPFQPKSFEEELRACQRYYEKNTGQIQFVKSASAYSRALFPWKVTKLATPTVVVKDMAGNVGKVSTYAANDTRTDNRIYITADGSVYQFLVTFNNADADVGGAFSEITASAEL